MPLRITLYALALQYALTLSNCCQSTPERTLSRLNNFDVIIDHGDEMAYTCSKLALRGFGQALNQELLPAGIKTYVFCPHAGAANFEVGAGKTREEVATSGFLTPDDVTTALLAVCTQPAHS